MIEPPGVLTRTRSGPAACGIRRIAVRSVGLPLAADERGATDDRPSVSHHRDPVRQRGAAPRARARVRADRRARPARARPRACRPLPDRHRRARRQERARGRGRGRGRAPRSWRATPTGSARSPTRSTSRTTTSSARAPTRATGPWSRRSGGVPLPTATSTATATRAGTARAARSSAMPTPRRPLPGARRAARTRRGGELVLPAVALRATRSVDLISERPPAHRARSAAQRGARVPRRARSRPQRLAAARPGPRTGASRFRAIPTRSSTCGSTRSPTTSARSASVAPTAQFAEWWDADGERVHVIGKGIVRFHAVIWPAILLSAGLPLPDDARRARLRDRGRTQDRQVARQRGRPAGRRSSASASTRCAGGCAARFPASARPTSPSERLVAVADRDLANGVGNLVQRIVTLAAPRLRRRSDTHARDG